MFPMPCLLWLNNTHSAFLLRSELLSLQLCSCIISSESETTTLQHVACAWRSSRWAGKRKTDRSGKKKITNCPGWKWVKWRLLGRCPAHFQMGEWWGWWGGWCVHRCLGFSPNTHKLTPAARNSTPQPTHHHQWKPCVAPRRGFTPETRCATSSGVAPLGETLPLADCSAANIHPVHLAPSSLTVGLPPHHKCTLNNEEGKSIFLG